MDGLESFIKTILFTEFGRKNAEGWMFLVAGVISFTGWMAAREMSGRVRRTKEEAQQNLSAENVMRASCHATDSGQITIATIRQEGTKYFLTLSVKNATTEIYEKRQHFDSLEALSAFLEKSTVLRLGDFRCS
jgi:hypothetical protein